MGSKWPFGLILNQFWQGLGKIWMRLGSSGALTIKTFASRAHAVKLKLLRHMVIS